MGMPVAEDPAERGFRGAAVEKLELAAAHLVVGTLGLLPHRLAIAFAEGLGLALGTAMAKWRSVAESNLRRALPELDPKDRQRIRRGVYRNLGRVAFALSKLPRWSGRTVQRHVVFSGLDHYRAAQAKGRGILLLTGHLGNWELGAMAHAAVHSPIHVLVRPIENRSVDRLVEGLRRSHGNTVITKKRAAREVLRVLADNGTVGILADQNCVREEAVFVQFFGLPASANKGIAQLALRSGAAVIPAFARWDDAARKHVVEYGPEVPVVRSGSRDRDIVQNSQAFQQALEDRIRKYPEQWLWIHRRWKTQPSGSDE